MRAVPKWYLPVAVSGSAAQAGATVFVLQGLVLLIAIGLVLLARQARSCGWLA